MKLMIITDSWESVRGLHERRGVEEHYHLDEWLTSMDRRHSYERRKNPQYNIPVTKHLKEIVSLLQQERNASVLIVEPSQCKLVSVPKIPGLKVARNPWKTRKLFKGFDPTHVHIATEGPLGLYYRWLMMWRGEKFSSSFFDMDFPSYMKKYWGFPTGASWEYLRKFHNKSSQIIVPTDFIGRVLKMWRFESNIVVREEGEDIKIFENALTPRR